MIDSSMITDSIEEKVQLDHYVVGFSDDSLYEEDDVSVLMRLQPSHILPFSVIYVNGRRKLVFETAKMRPLIDTANFFNFKEYLNALLLMIDTTIYICENEDLDIRKLLLDIERVYYDPVSEEISMIYLPVQIGYGDEFKCQIAFRSQMIRFTQMITGINAQTKDEFCERFASIIYPIEEIKIYIEQILESLSSDSVDVYDNEYSARVSEESADTEQIEDDNSLFPYGIQLSGFSMGSVISLNISTDNYIIGKSAVMADGVIDSSTVSRRHCRILTNSNRYYIEDMNSTNGTWLNDERLEKDYPRMLHEGDIITVSNVALEVRRLLCYM